MEIEKNELKKSEWIFAVVIITFIACIVFVAKKTSFHHLEYLSRVEKIASLPIIDVEITGSVQKPGIFHVQKNTTVRTIIRKARLKPIADLSRIDLDSPLKTSGCINIPSLENIVVRVEGCVTEPVTLTVRAGSRISDVKQYVQLTSDADAAVFKRRRMLKNNDIICVSSKKKG